MMARPVANDPSQRIGRVLITGGTGSFGKTMLRGLLAEGVSHIRILSRDEEKQDALRAELRDDRVRYYIGDIRDPEAVERAMEGVDLEITYWPRSG